MFHVCVFEWLLKLRRPVKIELFRHQAFVGTCPLIHKHVKMSEGKWILETTCSHKYVEISEEHFFPSPSSA